MSQENEQEGTIFPFEEDEMSGEAKLGDSEDVQKTPPRDKKQKIDAEAVPSTSEGRNPSPRPFMVAASPPKFISFEDIMKAANGVSNMALAHEIAVDNDFRFNKQELPENSLEKRVKDIMKRAFWDSLQEKLNEVPPDYSHALVLLEELKEKLEDLLMPHHSKIRTEIAEIMDLELIKQKVQHEALDFQYYANFVISVMARLCAPARDETIENLKQVQDVVPLFKNIFEVIELMKMDMANFTIQQIRPYLQQQSVEYEKAKFKEFLKESEESKVDGLQFTKGWLDRNTMELYYKSKSEAAGQEQAVLFTPSNIMNTAYLELLEWPHNQIYPETMLMDEKRFYDLERKLKLLTLISSIVLVTYNTVGGAIAGISDFKESMKEKISIILQDVPERDLKDALKNVAVEMDKDVCSCLSKHGYPALDEGRRNMLQGQITDVLLPDNAVYKLMKSRARSFIKEIITGKKPSELQVPTGFSAVTEELKHICGQFVRLVSHNRQVFGIYYADIISGLLQKCQQLDQQV